MPNMESLKTDGHYTLARKIFSKIKNWVENKVQTDVPANAVFTDYKSNVDLYMISQYYNQTLSKLRFDSTDFEGSMTSVGGGWTGTVRLKHHVGIDVPANAVFTDTTYSDATTSASGLMSAEDKTLVSTGISDAYDNTSTYDVGDIVIYNGSLYICNTAITTAEDFDPSKWDATNLGDVIASIYSFESDAVTKSAGGQITGGGLSFTSDGMPQQTTGSGVAMTMDTFANGGQLKWQNWDDVTVGKAKDSDTLGGAAADDEATNSTIAKRTSSGYIYAKYFNASNDNQATMTTSSSALYANSDGFLRKCTPTNFLKMFDSGWVTISGVGYYRRQSGFVIVLVNGYSINTRTWTTLTTLPSGYRPAYALNAAICGGDHRQYVGEVQVTTAGVVRAYVYTTARYYGQIIFPV